LKANEGIQDTLEDSKTDTINERHFITNVYKMQCDLLSIKKANAVLQQSYLQKKNKLIDQKLLEYDIDFMDQSNS